MKPQKNKKDPQFDLFQMELVRIVNTKHPLAILARQIDWNAFDEKFEAHYSEQGRPAIATRLMVSLHYLRYTHDLSDEETVAMWVENPYWQYFSGRQHFEHKLPIDPSSMSRWRKRVGADGAEELLKQTIQTAVKQKYVKRASCERVNVDTTVQPKAIRFPTDARSYNRMREVLVKSAKDHNIELRQTYAWVGKKALQSQQNYSYAKQGRRAAKQTRTLKTYLGRVVRDIERKKTSDSDELDHLLGVANRLLEQERHSKNKIYSIHEPHVECIAKGKTPKRYEFGCKVSFVTTAKSNWILGARAIHGNPYDGHTLQESLQQAQTLCGFKIKQATCDQGYKGHGIDDKTIHIVPRKKKRALASVRAWWRRRNAIEPIIGHVKSDHGLERNRLAGKLGDELNAMFSACGFNIKKLLRAFWLWLRNTLDCILGQTFQRTLCLQF